MSSDALKARYMHWMWYSNGKLDMPIVAGAHKRILSARGTGSTRTTQLGADQIRFSTHLKYRLLTYVVCSQNAKLHGLRPNRIVIHAVLQRGAQWMASSNEQAVCMWDIGDCATESNRPSTWREGRGRMPKKSSSSLNSNLTPYKSDTVPYDAWS